MELELESKTIYMEYMEAIACCVSVIFRHSVWHPVMIAWIEMNLIKLRLQYPVMGIVRLICLLQLICGMHVVESCN